jgi:hypothetical protein
MTPPGPLTHSDPESTSPLERHYTPAEVAKSLRLSAEAIRRLFYNEPGIFALPAPAKKGRRRYTTIRIPQSVLDRVLERLRIT